MYLPFTELFKFDYKKTGFVKIPDNIINELDLIHYTVFNSCSSIPFFINNPFIVTMHDLRLFYPEFSYKFSDKIYFTHKTMQQIFKKVSKKSKLILTEVDFVREDIKKFLNIKENKIKVLISPLPDIFMMKLKKDPHELTDVKNKYNLPNKFLFYPATIAKDKNHIRLIKALKLNIDKGFKINIVLSGSDGGYLREVLKLIEDLNLSDYIKYIGFVPLEDLVSLYHLSYGLIMPSLHESVSLPVWEAMVCGKPVATSNICGMPYQLGDLGIYFNPYDENDIADAMLKLWNLENTDEISHKLRDRAKKILDQESYAKELVKIYREALK
jgi:glycosyltransferase involved in cell wall biosynthesis